MSGLLMFFAVLETVAGLAAIGLIVNEVTEVGLILVPVTTVVGLLVLACAAIREIEYGYSSTVGGESVQGFGNAGGMMSIGIVVAINYYGGKNSDMIGIPVIEAVVLFGLTLCTTVFVRNKGEQWRRQNAPSSSSGTVVVGGRSIGSLDPQAVQHLADSLVQAAASMERVPALIDRLVVSLERSNQKAADLPVVFERTGAVLEKSMAGVQEFDRTLQHVAGLTESIKKFTVPV